MDTFYSQLAGICFTLLGLWWVVVQLKFDRMLATRGRRLTAYATSANFVAVGGIALVSILDGEVSQIWRVGTAAGAFLGALAAVYSVARGEMSRAQRASQAAAAALFVVAFGLAFWTQPIFGLRPIVVGALVEVGVVALSVHVVWQYFLEGQT